MFLSMPLRNLANAIIEIFFKKQKNETFIGKILIVLIFMLKTLIVGTR